MKKIISILLLLTFLFALVSCNNSENEVIDNQSKETDTQSEEVDTQTDNPGEVIDNQQEVDEFKALLNKQDLSPFYEKMFSSMFRQDYVSYINSYDDEDKNIDFFRYSGNGAYGYFYSVTREEYEEIMAKGDVNPFDFIVRGPGNYSLLQNAKINTLSSELVDGFDKTSTSDLSYYQRLDSQFDDTDLQVYSSYEINDKAGDIPTKKAEFNGKVNKAALLEVVSTSWLTDTIQRICAFDGHKTTEFLDGLYYDVCRDLLNKTDKEISGFLKTNNIVISNGEKYTEVSFELNDDAIKQILIDNDIFPGSFKGTLYYDKEAGSFEEFMYEINYTNNEFDEEEAHIYSSTLLFTATGYSYHHTYEGTPYFNPDAVVYADAYEFVNDMVDNIIPPIS